MEELNAVSDLLRIVRSACLPLRKAEAKAREKLFIKCFRSYAIGPAADALKHCTLNV